MWRMASGTQRESLGGLKYPVMERGCVCTGVAKDKTSYLLCWVIAPRRFSRKQKGSWYSKTV